MSGGPELPRGLAREISEVLRGCGTVVIHAAVIGALLGIVLWLSGK